MSLRKEQDVIRLVEAVTMALPLVTVIDHWEADLRAIGFISPARPGRLVYVSIHGNGHAQFNVIAESTVDGELRHEKVLEGLSIVHVIATIAEHLDLR